MRTLREILKLCRPGQKLTATDSQVVIDNALLSTQLTDRQKEIAVDSQTWYCVRSVCWSGRKLKCLHMCYPDCAIGLPLTLSKLEARPATRKSTRTSTDARDLVLAALRDIIRPQIDAFRTDFWQKYEHRVSVAVAMQMSPPAYPRCALSGKSLKSCKTHVDHDVVPFVRLAEAWVALTGQTFEHIAASVRKSRKLSRYTLGSSLADDSWAQYHSDNAKLQLVNARANMSKGCRVSD
jgi:hypothetical protein